MIDAVCNQPFIAYATNAPTGLTGTIGVTVLDTAENIVIPRSTDNITEMVAGSGIYQWSAPAAPATAGSYLVVWDSGQAPTDLYTSEPMTVLVAPLPVPGPPSPIDGIPVTDLTDLRVLIPACRRAIDGPTATYETAPSATLADQEVLNLLADSAATLILQTQGSPAFGYQLVVTARDPYYLAPVSWATDQPRVPAADAAILSQAALDHYFWMIKLLKVSESMKNEAVSWEYNLSATVIASWMAYLIANRDKAIAALQVINAPMDAYLSLVAERDRLAAAWLEPWVPEIGAPVPYVGGGGSGPLEYDYRFNTWG